MHLVLGAIERDGGTLYCTALFFGPDGVLLGTHRTVMPTAMERLICWENYMPLLRVSIYAQGVQYRRAKHATRHVPAYC